MHDHRPEPVQMRIARLCYPDVHLTRRLLRTTRGSELAGRDVINETDIELRNSCCNREHWQGYLLPFVVMSPTVNNECKTSMSALGRVFILCLKHLSPRNFLTAEQRYVSPARSVSMPDRREDNLHSKCSPVSRDRTSQMALPKPPLPSKPLLMPRLPATYFIQTTSIPSRDACSRSSETS